ncbi:MAG: glycosyltransferase family 2 protein [Lysobacterales bacterium]|nr:glycosyltransferase family 2 protein [Xanthomonadales bacterium]
MDPEVSIVMPCLNEAETVATCVRKARESLEKHGIEGEIIVADNGSTDGSQALAEAAGARIVDVREPGYGAALMGGIAAARGRFVLMGDADDSYDFGEAPKFVFKLREGFELVQGCRLPTGGGTVLPGAMPPLHFWLGNPLFSRLSRWWFRAPINDIYCGMRGFTRELYQRLDQRCIGMEFATEMVIKASLIKARIGEVPITLYPDGRSAHPPHLKTWRDGWRTLRFFLMCSPRWLFLIPGLLLLLLGVIGFALALPGALSWGGWQLDAHTLLVSSMLAVLGYQAIWFSIFAKTIAITSGVLPPDQRLERFHQRLSLERGVVLGALGAVVGAALVLAAVWQWAERGYGELPYALGMRLIIPGVTLITLGTQTIFASFLVSLMGLRRR